MANAQTKQQLAELNLSGLLKAYQALEQDLSFSEQTFDEKFAYLVNAEYERRINNRIQNRLREASFREAANLHEIDYEPQRKLNRDLIERLATNQWIRNKENIIITGSTGTGKSYLAQALGTHACRHDFKVKYYRLPELIHELQFGKQANSYNKIRQSLKKKDILILDDWGMATLNVLTGHEIADLIEDRLKQKSTIVVSQYPVHLWDQIFDDKTTADAVMDRLIHRAFVIPLEGPSRRQFTASEELKAYQQSMLE